MAVQLAIPYETLLELIRQLPEQQKSALLHELLRTRPPTELSADEKIRLLKSIQISLPLAEGFDFSDRREDWYDDDGR